MTDFDIHRFYRDYIAALNDRAFGVMDRFVADVVSLNGQPGTRDAVVADQKSIIDAVPDFHWEVQEFLEDGDRAAVRLVNTGTPVEQCTAWPRPGRRSAPSSTRSTASRTAGSWR